MKKYAFLLSLKSLAVNVAADAAGGLLIGAATYNFAAAADLPLAGVNGIALIFYQLWEFPIGRMAMLMNIPIALVCFRILGRDFFLRSLRDHPHHITDYGLRGAFASSLYRRPPSGLSLHRRALRPGPGHYLYAGLLHRGNRLHPSVLKSQTPAYVSWKLTLLLDCSVIFFSVLLVSRNIDGPDLRTDQHLSGLHRDG